jgi:hypothetical protein
MSDATCIRTMRDTKVQPQRTRIEELSKVGYELSEEELCLVYGGLVVNQVDPSRFSTCTNQHAIGGTEGDGVTFP